MTSGDLQRIDELVQVADVAVRIASQLRLWQKRRSLRDAEAIEAGIRFLGDAVRGGKFLDTGEIAPGSASLYPLSWSADVRLHSKSYSELQPNESQPDYDALVSYFDGLQQTLQSVNADKNVANDAVVDAATFFDQLGHFLGVKADNALRTPANWDPTLQERF